jgi:hypothetical protein
VFATAAEDHTLELDQRMIELLGIAVSATLRNALLSDMPLAFRGHLALGHGLLEDGLLVGEAVDTAAENHERADAACVWLCPIASAVVESIDPKKLTGNWIQSDIPLVESKRKKDETTPVRAVAINPCGITPERRRHEELIAKMHAAFDSGQDPVRPSVVVKRSNSIRFLEECSSAAKDWHELQGFPNARNL